MRCTPVRYTPMRCTPVRYTPMRHLPANFGGSLAQTVVDLSRSELQNTSFCASCEVVHIALSIWRMTAVN